MDLHGLHAAEASELLLDLLPAFCPAFVPEQDLVGPPSGVNKTLVARIRAQSNESVLVVTGSGHHTRPGGAHHSKLFESVKSFLTYWGLMYQIVKDGNGYEGAFRISTR